ncbi:SAM-dependent methyltransferase [Paenibacillus graminis]|uniref:Methyltransferase type 12 domain-containing protein n=1 Tax=Paenibacillus graminis TaxID=189425 RepID=A0A089M317_9BACL|nr:methyltransferase [Paenibacillus graminis]AIQ68161.1 hypothetical protein PGRAT_11460 [Paenibacillus graminis]
MDQHKGNMIATYSESRQGNIVKAGSTKGFMNLGYERYSLEKTSSRQKQIQMVDHIFELLKPEVNEDIADVGCGIGGAMTRLLSTFSVKSVTGFNIDPLQLEACRSLLEEYRVVQRAHLNEVNLEEEGLRGQLFDKIYGIEILTHIRNKEKFLQHLYNGIKPGGRLVLAYTTLARPFHEFRGEDQEFMLKIGEYFKETPEDFLTERDYKELLNDVGFREEKTVNVSDHVFPHRHAHMAKTYAQLNSKNLIVKTVSSYYWKNKERCDIDYLNTFLKDQIAKHQCRMYEYYLTAWRK